MKWELTMLSIKVQTYQGTVLKENISFRVLNEFIKEILDEKLNVVELDKEKIRRGTILSVHVFEKGERKVPVYQSNQELPDGI